MKTYHLFIYWSTASGTGSTAVDVKAYTMAEAKAQAYFEANYREGYKLEGIE